MSSSYSYSSTSYSSSSTTRNGETTGRAFAHETHSDPSGTTVRQTSQNMGQPAVQETRYYDNSGRELPANAQGGRLEGPGSGAYYGGSGGGGSGSGQGSRRIQDVTDRDDGYRPAQSGETEADARYRERMEDEYAKREGGA